MTHEPSPDPRPDVELVRDADFDALYWRYRDWVVRLAWRFTGDQDDALDVLQDVFVYLACKLPTLKLTASMKTFLYPAVRNISLVVRQKRQRITLNSATMDAVPAPIAPTDPRAELAAVLKEIPETHREVLLARFVDGLSLEEIAGALKIPLGTVKSRMHNALQQLREDARTRQYFES